MRSTDRTKASDVSASIRALHSYEDLTGCVREQRETWGEDYNDIVPAAILQVAQKVGGVAAGAFVDDALVGFVFGLTGPRGGRLVHWSHMLAVQPELRNRGIGRRLKEFQRDAVRALGVELMHWTFDPLVARNAHLNVNRLGVRVDEYVPDMYGDTGSELHRFGTDRFIVSWRLDAAVPTGNEEPTEGLSSLGPGEVPSAKRVRIEIPHDAEAMFADAPDEAVAWRKRTREAFLACIGRGYVVAGFEVEPGSERCFYVLASASTGDEQSG